jgi:SdpI/YfhL protein family
VALRIIVLCAYVPLGVLVAALGIPMIGRKIPPNSWYGFRVSKTLNDPKVWYDANEFSGRCLFGLGVVMSLAGLVLFFIPAIDSIIYALICNAITLVGVAVSVFLSYRYLNRITNTLRYGWRGGCDLGSMFRAQPGTTRRRLLASRHETQRVSSFVHTSSLAPSIHVRRDESTGRCATTQRRSILCLACE